ncbi:MAG: response regulator [Verrucomicrobia bacterium]|nr:response regulator [Verrucomicrobiota bacterium]
MTMQTAADHRLPSSKKNSHLPMKSNGYGPPPPSLLGVRFVLVDDQTEVAAALAASLAHYARMVCAGVFADGQRALDHLKRRRVDLVLLDLLMPAMPGVEFLRRLKKQAGAAVPPVLVRRRCARTRGASSASWACTAVPPQWRCAGGRRRRKKIPGPGYRHCPPQIS